MRICYSALFGKYEEIKEPKIVTPDWKYILFTDQPVTSKIWEIRHVANVENPQMLAREFKIKRWTEWEESLWIDASFFIDTDLNLWWDKYFKHDFSAPGHPWRSCVYDEILACIIDKRRGKYEDLVRQRDDYKKEGVQGGKGIISSGLIMRKRTPECIELCSKWWDEVQKYSIRDQVAFGKVSQQFPGIVNTFQWDYTKEKDFLYWQHYNRR